MNKDSASSQNTLAAVLLPVLLIACVYFTIIRPKVSGRLVRARQDVVDTRARIPTDAALRAALDESDRLRVELRAAQDAHRTTDRTRPPTSQDRRTRDGSVAAWLRRLSSILDQHGITIITDEEHEVEVPAELRRNPADRLMVARKMELAGSYGAIVRALHDIHLSEPHRIVLDLVLQSAPSTGTLRWKVTIG